MPRAIVENPQMDGSTFELPGGKAGILLLHGFSLESQRRCVRWPLT